MKESGTGIGNWDRELGSGTGVGNWDRKPRPKRPDGEGPRIVACLRLRRVTTITLQTPEHEKSSKSAKYGDASMSKSQIPHQAWIFIAESAIVRTPPEPGRKRRPPRSGKASMKDCVEMPRQVATLERSRRGGYRGVPLELLLTMLHLGLESGQDRRVHLADPALGEVQRETDLLHGHLLVVVEDDDEPFRP